MARSPLPSGLPLAAEANMKSKNAKRGSLRAGFRGVSESGRIQGGFPNPRRCYTAASVNQLVAGDCTRLDTSSPETSASGIAWLLELLLASALGAEFR
jgi:hypothetical protein